LQQQSHIEHLCELAAQLYAIDLQRLSVMTRQKWQQLQSEIVQDFSTLYYSSNPEIVLVEHKERQKQWQKHLEEITTQVAPPTLPAVPGVKQAAVASLAMELNRSNLGFFPSYRLSSSSFVASSGSTEKAATQLDEPTEGEHSGPTDPTEPMALLYNMKPLLY
jgi:hypothetical protein